MSSKITSDENWVEPGIIKFSSAALAFARDFADIVARDQTGEWVIAFCWAEAISVKRAPDAMYEDIGSSLTLGAFKRAEIPPGFIDVQDGLELVIQVPRSIWQKSVHRLIDLDEALLFKLTLR